MVPSCSRLKTMAGRHIDKMIRTRNFKARYQRIETGALVKSQSGRKVSVERKVRECYQWKATEQCSKKDSCNFSHGEAPRNRRGHGQKGQSSSLVPKAWTQTDGKNHRKVLVSEVKVLLEEMAVKRAKISSEESERIRRVIIGILPYVKSTNLNREANSATSLLFRHTEADGQPSKV